jgi:hypothetical protein
MQITLNSGERKRNHPKLKTAGNCCFNFELLWLWQHYLSLGFMFGNNGFGPLLFGFTQKHLVFFPFLIFNVPTLNISPMFSYLTITIPEASVLSEIWVTSSKHNIGYLAVCGTHHHLASTHCTYCSCRHS